MAAINHPLGQGRRALPLPLPRINGWILAAILVAGVGASLPVLQNSTATSRGFDIQQLQARRATIEGDISVLESEIARLTSLDRIERRAEEIGLHPAEDPIYVSVDEAGPAPAKLPAEYLPRATPQAERPDPWWQSLFRWLPLLD